MHLPTPQIRHRTGTHVPHLLRTHAQRLGNHRHTIRLKPRLRHKRAYRPQHPQILILRPWAPRVLILLHRDIHKTRVFDLLVDIVDLREVDAKFFARRVVVVLDVVPELGVLVVGAVVALDIEVVLYTSRSAMTILRKETSRSPPISINPPG